jgi:hypothetical protein
MRSPLPLPNLLLNPTYLYLPWELKNRPKLGGLFDIFLTFNRYLDTFFMRITIE